VGSLAYLLKNRFYIGEITYRGKVHRGEHEPILSRDLFKAVQAKRAANAVDRQVRLRGSAAILTGRLFDDRGNRMSPTHTNKQGARYRYYVSHALLQNRKAEAGSIARVPAPDLEPSIASADAKRSISIPWSPPIARRRKGVLHLPASHDLDSRDALLMAIAKARSWIDDLINGRVQSFDPPLRNSRTSS
jgi:site-specific DNA recombinase